jgi:hypothetical protein
VITDRDRLRIEQGVEDLDHPGSAGFAFWCGVDGSRDQLVAPAIHDIADRSMLPRSNCEIFREVLGERSAPVTD